VRHQKLWLTFGTTLVRSVVGIVLIECHAKNVCIIFGSDYAESDFVRNLPRNGSFSVCSSFHVNHALYILSALRARGWSTVLVFQRLHGYNASALNLGSIFFISFLRQDKARKLDL